MVRMCDPRRPGPSPLAMVAAFPTGAKMEEMRPFLKTMRRFEMDMETKGKTISYAVTTKDAVPKLTLSFYPAIAAFVNGELAQGQSEQSTNDFFPDNPQAKANAAKKAEGGGNAAAERIAAAAAQAEQLAAGISEDEMDEL